MKSGHSSELEEIRQIQADLKWKLGSVERRIQELEKKLSEEDVKEIERAAEPVVMPPPLPVEEDSVVAEKSAFANGTTPENLSQEELPPLIPPSQVPQTPPAFETKEEKSAAPSPTVSTPPIAPNPPELPKDSMELRVGRVWLVRAGILILLTGLVFLGNFAWQEFVMKVGPAAKLALLFVVGGLLAGVGSWCRKKSEGLRSYGNVLTGGGIATVYYATYAAHFVEPLRVISSPLVGGMLLLAVAGAILWIADRKRLQVVATITTALGFYTAAINPIAGFSLFSNLLLSAVAIILLIRRKWVAIPFVSLIGCFIGFAFWRFFNSGTLLPLEAGTQAEFLNGVLFPACYWVVFSVAVFVARTPKFQGVLRSAFLTINNGAFYGLTAPLVAGTHPSNFWIYTFGFGMVLLLLAFFARKSAPDDRAFDGSYLTQGLGLGTLGLLFKVSGYQAAILFAMQSAALMKFSRTHHGKILQVFSGLTGMTATGWALYSVSTSAPHAALTCVATSLILLSTAWVFKHQRGLLENLSAQKRSGAFVLLAAVLAVAAIAHATRTDPVLCVALLLGVSLVGLLSLRWLRMPEVVLASQGFLVLAFLRYLGLPDKAGLLPMLLMLGVGLFHLHCWANLIPKRPGAIQRIVWPLFHATIVVGSLFAWSVKFFSPPHQLPVFAAIALLLLLHGFLSRVWALAVIGQLFTLTLVIRYLELVPNGVPWILSLSAVVLMALQSAASGLLQNRVPEIPVSRLVVHRRFVEIAAILGGLILIVHDVPVPWLCLALSVFAILMFGTAAKFHGIPALFYSAFLFLVAGLFFLKGTMAYDQTLIANMSFPVFLLLSQQIGKRRFEGIAFYPGWVQQACIIIGVLAGWFFVGDFVSSKFHGFLLTISWAAVAGISLTAGFLLRERTYRMMGLGIFCCAIGRVFAVDVWELETIYRILSFLVLGVILVSAGFLYNRFAESLRKWM